MENQTIGTAPAATMQNRHSRSALWRRIQDDQVDVLAVMGMSKNTGKTVVLNHLLEQAAREHLTCGLTSIGRDGEDRDQVFSNPKPPILVWPGNLVATARETLHRAKVGWKLIANTGIDSPMGEIIILKVLDYGSMEVAGASRGHDQLKIITMLKQCGAGMVILDGALGRSHHASPAIANGVILATGAALGGAIGDVIRKTRDRLGILGIAQADLTLRTLCAPVFEAGGVGVWDQQGQPLFLANIATLNAAAKLMAVVQELEFGSASGSENTQIKTIALSGAVGRQLGQALYSIAQKFPGLQVVVADGTKLFIEHQELIAFEKLGAKLLGMRAIRLNCITLNPFSPMGGSFQAAEFLQAAQQAFTGYQVCDVLLSESV